MMLQKTLREDAVIVWLVSEMRTRVFLLPWPKTQEEALTNEYNLTYSVYSELAKQMEQAKIAVNETTPILTIVEPVVVPIERSKPKRGIEFACCLRSWEALLEWVRFWHYLLWLMFWEMIN